MPSLPRSLPRICVALGLETPAQLTRTAESEYKDGNTFLEFRLDYLSSPVSGIDVIRAVSKRYPDIQILATCRHAQNGGKFNGAVQQQIKILQAAGRAGAVGLDLEIESAESVKSELNVLRETAALIVSYHNFQKTPALEPVLRRLERVAADAYKLVVTAVKPSDTLRTLEFARAHQNGIPFTTFAMSEAGVATRVLAPSCGCIFTYGAPSKQAGTAPGQLSAHLLHSLYRCEKLTRNTRVYGVIADPVSHSKSPLIHNRAFQARRLDSVYLPFRVAASQLGDWFKLADELPVAGFSVTIPHKQRVMRYLDAVDPLAKRIGAVNTVWRKAGKWRGTNTDVEGILKPLQRHMRLGHSSVLVAGYGGAARAAAISLSDAGASVSITGRNFKSAQALARAAHAEAISLKEAQTRGFDALVHATPVGMSPKPDECLFCDQIPADLVFDMVYNPHETVLLKRASQQGCTVIYGSEMFLEQAARQFEIWTGETAPRIVMQRALERGSN